jgi:hypothetical protein
MFNCLMSKVHVQVNHIVVSSPTICTDDRARLDIVFNDCAQRQLVSVIDCYRGPSIISRLGGEVKCLEIIEG